MKQSGFFFHFRKKITARLRIDDRRSVGFRESASWDKELWHPRRNGFVQVASVLTTSVDNGEGQVAEV